MLGCVGTQVHVNVRRRMDRSRLYHLRPLFLLLGTATSAQSSIFFRAHKERKKGPDRLIPRDL